MPSHKTAYVTGGASGIARAVVEMLVSRNIRVAVADMNFEGVKTVPEYCNYQQQKQHPESPPIVVPYEVNAGSWASQLSTFQKVVKEFGRVDLVYPIAGIGERRSIPNDPKAEGFVRPDLSAIDVDLYGFIYTVSLAVQQFRRQAKDEDGFRGKTLPMYTAAKHGVVGFVRSYGKYLPEECITLNAVCPNVVRTGISTTEFYDKMEEKGLLTPMEAVVQAFEQFLDGDVSGQCVEAGPKGDLVPREPPEHLDRESAVVMEMLYERGHPLHEPKS